MFVFDLHISWRDYDDMPFDLWEAGKARCDAIIESREGA